MSVKDLESKVMELKELQRLFEEVEQEMESIKDLIKSEMTAQDTEEITAGMFKVRYTTVKSSRFDSKAFQKTHADLYDQYKKENVTKRFSIA